MYVSKRNLRGYSIVEMLVVIAIIGILALVTVPNFINMMRSAEIKSSMRQFMSDLRSARQIAITKNRITKVSFEVGPNSRTYRIFESPNQPAPVWTPVPPAVRTLEDSIHFEATTFTNATFNGVADADTALDIVFRPNGTVDPLPTETENGNSVTKVSLRTDWKIPINQYDIYLSSTGGMTSAGKNN